MRIRKKSGDNRGLTLIELVVAVAISVVALGAIWQFLLVSTRTYESQKAEAELQQEVQQTMNQVQNLLIDTNRAIAYYYEDGADYKQFSNDYDAPKDASKRLEVYNNETVAHLTWDKEEQEVIYKETTRDKAESTSEADWESAVLADGVESMAVDVSQVEDKQVLKVKMSFVRNNKTYTATRSIAMRNSIANTGNTDDIYDDPVGVVKPLIVITPVDGNTLYPRDDHDFEATVTNATDTNLLWTVQGQTCEDTYMNLTTGYLVVGALEKAEELTVVATLESDRTVNGIYKLSVGDPKKPTVEVKDERGDGAKGEHIQAPIDTDELIINALCGEKYKIPIKADVNPKEYSHKWTMRTKDGVVSDAIDAKVTVVREGNALQEYLVIGENQVEDFWLEATVVSNEAENGTDLCYVNVVPPVPEIEIEYVENANGTRKSGTTTSDISLYGGADVKIRANWTGVLQTASQPFGYEADEFEKEHDVEWVITTIKDGKVIKTDREVCAATETIKKLQKIDYYGVDSIQITAASQKYKNVEFPTVTITVKTPELSLKAYKVTEDKEVMVDETEELGFYQDIHMVPEYVGGRTDNLNWSIQLKDRETGVEVESPVLSNLLEDDFSALWNTAKTYFGGKNMVGQEVTVTISEKDAPDVKASVTFIVKKATVCDFKINDMTSLEQALKAENANVKEYNYLQPNAEFDYENSSGEKVGSKYIANYGFLATIDYNGEIVIGDYYIQKSKEVLSNASDIKYVIEATKQKEENSILFAPKIPDQATRVSDIRSIIYDINDKYTGEHVCFVKLNMTLSNYNASIKKSAYFGTSTVGYVAYSSPISITTLNKVSGWESKPTQYSDKMEFCNYYGWEFLSTEHANINYSRLVSVPYKCVYEYNSGLWGLIGTSWKITINENDTSNVYTATYN